jgi:hypothetical protein
VGFVLSRSDHSNRVSTRGGTHARMLAPQSHASEANLRSFTARAPKQPGQYARWRLMEIPASCSTPRDSNRDPFGLVGAVSPDAGCARNRRSGTS